MIGSRLIAAVFGLLVVAACSPQPSAEQLEWCAENQARVGRSALELRLFDDSLSFTVWKQSNPELYERACIHAFERR